MSIINKIIDRARELNLEVHGETVSSASVSTSSFTGLTLHLETDNDAVLFYFSHRTSSWDYNGERTDLNDVIPLIFSAFLQNLNISSLNIIDIINPATGEESEIYARYLLPIQISKEFLDKKEIKYVDQFLQLIGKLVFFEQNFWNCFGGCPCINCRNRLGYQYDFRFDNLKNRIKKIGKALYSNDASNFCERTLPTWFYYRDYKKDLSLLVSPGLIEFLNAIYSDKSQESITGIGGTLIIKNEFNHFVGDFIKRKIKRHFLNLKDPNPRMLPMENKIIAFGKKYIISYGIECGYSSFRKAKNKLKERHDREYKALFKPSVLEWAELINDSDFENLIKDLLEREPNVKRVRKVSHTRERDGGTDLIAEWLIPKSFGREGEMPYQKANVIIQCKVGQKGIGKDKVIDIRDTIEFRDYDGYFLAVSSYLRKSLTDHLDKLRISNKFWIDWWGRDEIDHKLKQHRDLLIKYSSIVSSKEP